MKMKIKGLIPSIIGAVLLILGFILSQTNEYKYGANSRGFDDKSSRQAVIFFMIVGAVLLIIGLFRLLTSYKNQQNNINNPQFPSNNSTPMNNIINNKVSPNSNINNQVQGIPCSRCNLIIEPHNKFCRYCGTERLSKKLCPACKNEMPINNSFCSRCGTHL